MEENQLEIDGVVYTVKELKVKDMLDLIGSGEDVNFGLETLKRAVCVDGEPIGDALEELPISAFVKLSGIVNNLNSAEGND